ncbi:MAG: chitooligosaccharide deacetylase NodB [Mesorhizobium sp.]|uniref:chitooligosaccharide deacetylase NodB n=1 Tax=unclassified Mesorhizobium TaxID=325217 RepID=UPI000F7562E7|nr:MULTISPECIES: chitooligosaccharide deacetylase NodB [unclassified Mesorhizobium]RVC82515.1 chitooligosaccharide deacetylase NodB [Mesorhizobium sp. M2A.F.Ca.ET.046.02.1.1]AZO34117.1 chitooligosaccharide deacetylase NodB [Mesorhizobium sp. M2A.F.Ca.ET.046.03.2.1]AZO71545.1 chitooligosaccharide deacetylase NodB [Mesorhizobium sp. M1D.F.Ca.ET.043.01.1.1]RWB39377.1 MAG: chitooligosaccharide deacetylase NodB [Mesorhizobium sp.]RWE19711.1 MAG: chitooligosaccharide deacetylase NodB [Mesorhizobium 
MKHLDKIYEVQSECADGTGRPSVYLTFDDGPDPFFTPQILDVLAQNGVPATFFVIGAYAAEHPDLLQRMIAEGHEVGNHTMSHPDLSKCGLGEVQREVFEANRAIMGACPQASIRYIRAPYGAWSEEVFTASQIAGLAALHWSIDPRDWARPGTDAIVDAVLASVRPGAIVLLHDGCPPDDSGTQAGLRDQTVVALSNLIPALHASGYEIRSLPVHH